MQASTSPDLEQGIDALQAVLGAEYSREHLTNALSKFNGNPDMAIGWLIDNPEPQHTGGAAESGNGGESKGKHDYDAWGTEPAEGADRGTGELGWGEPVITLKTPVLDDPWGSITAASEARAPEKLPDSPESRPYEPRIIPSPSSQAITVPSAPPGSPSNRPKDYIDLTGADDLPDLITADGTVAHRGGKEFVDDDLAKAIEMSLREAGGGGNNEKSRGLGLGISKEDAEMNKAVEESLAMTSSFSMERDKRWVDPPPLERKRNVNASGQIDPVALRIPSPHFSFLPPAVLALFAAKPFRDAILAFRPPKDISATAGRDMSELVKSLGDVEGCWKGGSSDGSEELDGWWPGDIGHELEMTEVIGPTENLLCLQRIFALMVHSTRKYLTTPLTALSHTLEYAEGNNITWAIGEPGKGVASAYRELSDKWKMVEWERQKGMVKREEIDETEASKAWHAAAHVMHWTGESLPIPIPPSPTVRASSGLFEEPSPLGTSTAAMSLPVNPTSTNLNSLYPCIDSQIYTPEQKQAHWLESTSSVIAFSLDRPGSAGVGGFSGIGPQPFKEGATSGGFKTVFGVEKELWVDRWCYEKRRRVCELREQVAKVLSDGEVAEIRKAALEKHDGKDVIGLLKATISHLENPVHPPDEDRTKRHALLHANYTKALSKLETEIMSLDIRIAAAQKSSKDVLETPEMKEFGPYELCAAVVHDGFQGREHLWTYTRLDDGRWFRLMDILVEEVSLAQVLKDSAGLYAGGGHVFLVYTRKSEPGATDSTDVEIPENLMRGIKEDNNLFEAECLAALVRPTNGNNPVPSTSRVLNAGSDIEMDVPSSPRSDVAEFDGREHDDMGGNSEVIDSPMRLKGGSAVVEDDDDEDRDEDGSDEEGEDFVELGFLKKIKKSLDPVTMTGKVGGQPIWINPTLPLGGDQLKCSSCGDTMSFLLQMHAPDDANTDAYFRAIYVFTCRKVSCLRLHGPGAVKAFRIQLSENNPYYSGDLEPDVEQEIETVRKGLQSLGKDHPKFREWEIICDSEPEEEINLPSSSSPATPTPSSNDKSDARAKDTKAPVDQTFLQFQARLFRAPSQILRYLRLSDQPIEPLWASAEDRPTTLTVPPCPHCQSERTSEFQVMPTLLSYLGVDAAAPDSLDFGTIVIYTCARSCTIPPPSLQSPQTGKLTSNSGWSQEVCIVQAFSSAGVEFGPGKRT